MATRGPDRNVTDEELIAAVRQAVNNTPGPVASTSEIAANVSMSGQRIRERVGRISLINSKNVGGSGPRIYWLSDG